MVMSDVLPLAEVKAKFWEMVDRVEQQHERITVTRNDRPGVVEFLLGPLVENPRRVGHPLQRELAGLWSARRGAYRVVYEIDDEDRIVDVLRIEHRSDVYRPR